MEYENNVWLNFAAMKTLFNNLRDEDRKLC